MRQNWNKFLYNSCFQEDEPFRFYWPFVPQDKLNWTFLAPLMVRLQGQKNQKDVVHIAATVNTAMIAGLYIIEL